jgi:pimeloyl-ACP methyl ester carboxylesterase
MLKTSPVAAKGLISLWADPRRKPERFYRQMTAGFPQSDREVLARPGVFAAQTASVREAVRQGLDGFVSELTLAARPWGFDLSDVGPIRASVWHGEEDTSTPIEMGHDLAAIDGARAHFIEGAGHFLHHDYFPDIIDELLG